MRNKSLVFRSCSPNTLCGISVRFQTLSPTQGQVAHALLTRPPLTQPRRASSVRLECVMHAASVHPEPGSNSRKYCIFTPRGVNLYLRAFVALLLFVLSLFSLRIVRDSTSHFLCLLCTYLFVVQFSMTVRSASRPRSRLRSRGDSIIISHCLLFVNTFFQTFLKFFSAPPLRRQL